MKLISDIIDFLDGHVKHYRKANPDMGLPEDLFNCVTRMPPIMNVDLLLRDSNNRLLLAWRDDEFSGQGWHIPGGIVGFNETLHYRVKKVAEIELGIIEGEFSFDPDPIAYNEVFLHRETRSHFFSILYNLNNKQNFYTFIVNQKIIPKTGKKGNKNYPCIEVCKKLKEVLDDKVQ